MRFTVQNKILLVSILCIIAFLSGYYFGGLKKIESIKVEYIEKEVIRDSVKVPKPHKEEKPIVSNLPTRRDTIYIDRKVYITEVVDTAKIIEDYEMKRYYSLPLFDNKFGKLDVNLSTQHNSLQDLSYEFIPRVRVETITMEKTFFPFSSANISTFGVFGFGGGVFYKKTGLEYNYQIDLKSGKNGHLIGFKYRF